MKHLRYLAVLLALAVPGANAIQAPGSPEEVRERLRAFGQVCRMGEICPAPSAGPTLPGDGPNWTVMDPVDSPAEQTGQRNVKSRWVSTDIRWPETSASITLSTGMDSSMRFTYLALAGGEKSRYGGWENHWMTLGVGEREKDFRVRRPSGEQRVLLLGTGPANFLKQALEEYAGETLTVQLRFQGEGPVEFRFPLEGAAESLHAVGMIDEAAVEAIARLAADREAEAPAALPPTPAPVALTASGGPRTGQQIYDTFCFACHATGVTEAPLFGSLEQWQPRIDKGMDTLVATSLTGLNLMPPMGICMSCTEDEMRDAIQYMIDSTQ